MARNARSETAARTPLGHHRHAHHHIGPHQKPEVVVLEGRLDARGEHQDAAHLDDGDDPVEPVVDREGGREPGEVHPRPPDAEEGHGIDEDAVEHLPVGQLVVQLGGGHAHRHHEDQVEEQFKTRGGAMRFVRVAGAHRGESGGRSRRGR
nr:hypothetical protein [Acidipropionibacterium acidipropionici]